MTRMFHGEPLDETRSRHMATIKGKNTKPELALRKALAARGVRYRVHARKLPGTPDIANRRAKLAIFVDGCFWHGCPTHYTIPKTRAIYWKEKVERNVAKRREVLAAYPADWRVHSFFECTLRTNVDAVARQLLPYFR